MREIKYRLYDKKGDIIGYEHHVKNEFGCYQIYHESLRGDFSDKVELKLVREGYFIAATEKYEYVGKKDKNDNYIFENDICTADFITRFDIVKLEGRIIMDDYMWCLENIEDGEIYSINRLTNMEIVE